MAYAVLTFVFLQSLLGGLQDGLVELVSKLLGKERFPLLVLPVHTMGERNRDLFRQRAPDTVQEAEVLLDRVPVAQPGPLSRKRNGVFGSGKVMWSQMICSAGLRGLLGFWQRSWSHVDRFIRLQRRRLLNL